MKTKTFIREKADPALARAALFFFRQNILVQSGHDESRDFAFVNVSESDIFQSFSYNLTLPSTDSDEDEIVQPIQPIVEVLVSGISVSEPSTLTQKEIGFITVDDIFNDCMNAYIKLAKRH